MCDLLQAGIYTTMATKQEDKKTLQLFRESDRLVSSGKLSASQKLQEMTIDLDPSNSKEVRAFYDEMPDTVKTFVKWEREAERITLETSEIGESLIMALDGLKQDPPKYTEQEVYEDFMSTERIDKIKNLQSETAHFKAIDAGKLAQDAARDFSWWEQFANDATEIGTTATGCAGAAGVLVAGAALANPVGIGVVGSSALVVLTFQLLIGFNRSWRNKKGKLNLRDKALIISDICESIRRYVQLLDKIGVYASNIAKCQEKVQTSGEINNLQRDKIIKSAKKMKEACNQYLGREIQDE